jgi:hypothetical protein
MDSIPLDLPVKVRILQNFDTSGSPSGGASGLLLAVRVALVRGTSSVVLSRCGPMTLPPEPVAANAGPSPATASCTASMRLGRERCRAWLAAGCVAVWTVACGPRVSRNSDGEDPLCSSDRQDEVDPLSDFDGACSSYDRFPFSYPADLEPIGVTIVNKLPHPVLVFNRLDGCDAMRYTRSRTRHFSMEGEVAGRQVATPATSCPMGWPSCADTVFWDSEPSAEEVDAMPEGLICRLCDRLPGPIYIESCLSSGVESECGVAVSPPPAGRYVVDVAVALASDCGFDFDECLYTRDACEDFDHDLGSGPLRSEWLHSPCEPSFTALATWHGGCDPIEVYIESQ